MEKDWRLFNQNNYLYKKKLQKSKFLASKSREHTHCSFCWEKFGDSEGLLHEGYCTEDKYYWICEHCYNDFKELFHWRIG